MVRRTCCRVWGRRSGYGALLAQGSNAVTLSDAGAAGAVLIGDAGPTTFVSTGAGVSLMGVSLVGGAGQNRFVVSGSATISTGSGASKVVGSGQAALSVSTGTGGNLVVLAGGASTVQLGSGTSTVFAFGTSAVTAGSGSASLVMGSAVTFNIGAGNIAAGAAHSFALFNFVPGTDKISLQGHGGGTVGNAIANQVNGAGQTVLTLSDQTRVQLIGVTRADAGIFA